MAQFKVGDCVRIREDLLVDEYHDNYDITDDDGVCFVEQMLQYCGLIATIEHIWEGEDCDEYSLDIDDGEWCWAGSMLEPLKPKKKNQRGFNKLLGVR